jgi:hypothetical protein
MTRPNKLLYGFGIVVLLVSLYFNWTTQKTNQNYKANAQANLVLGVTIIGQADGLTKNGNAKGAIALAYEGIGYLRGSDRGMQQLGVNNVSGIANFLDQAMTNLLDLGKQPADAATKAHDQQVINVLEKSFKPFGRVNYGSLNNAQLEHAINQVYEAMTPQERQNFAGEE